MFIVQLSYKVPLHEVDKYLSAHREYLSYFYKQGLLLVSGPLIERTGGIIIALTKDQSYLESILQQDPFYLAEIADYKLLEFNPVMYNKSLQEIIC